MVFLPVTQPDITLYQSVKLGSDVGRVLYAAQCENSIQQSSDSPVCDGGWTTHRKNTQISPYIPVCKVLTHFSVYIFQFTEQLLNYGRAEDKKKTET